MESDVHFSGRGSIANDERKIVVVRGQKVGKVKRSGSR